MLLWIHDTRCEAKLISAKFLMLGDDLSVWDFLSSMTFDDFSKFHDFPGLFQKILFFHVFQTLWEPWCIQEYSGFNHRMVNSLAPGRFDCNLKSLIFKLISKIYIYLEHFLWNGIDMNTTRPHWWLVSIGSGNGLVLSGNKPLSKPMFTQIYVTRWHPYCD